MDHQVHLLFVRGQKILFLWSLLVVGVFVGAGPLHPGCLMSRRTAVVMVFRFRGRGGVPQLSPAFSHLSPLSLSVWL